MTTLIKKLPNQLGNIWYGLYNKIFGPLKYAPKNYNSIFTSKRYLFTKNQTVTLVFTTPLIGLLPGGRIRRFCGQLCYMIAFRIMVSGLCGVVTYHDLQYKPKTTGLCVANHTSVIDVAILSSKHCYSMVGFFLFFFGLGYHGILCLYVLNLCDVFVLLFYFTIVVCICYDFSTDCFHCWKYNFKGWLFSITQTTFVIRR